MGCWPKRYGGTLEGAAVVEKGMMFRAVFSGWYGRHVENVIDGRVLRLFM